jgi:hypothetical protein
MDPALATQVASPAERLERAGAAAGGPFLVLRDGGGRQRIHPLDPAAGPVHVGRASDADVVIGWDAEVSRRHAVIACDDGVWTVADEGLSRNGTHVGSTRVTAPRPLRDGDVVRVGRTRIAFRDPRP